MSESRTLAREKISEREHGEERVGSTVKEGNSKEESDGTQEESPLKK